jgi:hypothetical protein
MRCGKTSSIWEVSKYPWHLSYCKNGLADNLSFHRDLVTSDSTQSSGDWPDADMSFSELPVIRFVFVRFVSTLFNRSLEFDTPPYVHPRCLAFIGEGGTVCQASILEVGPWNPMMTRCLLSSMIYLEATFLIH